MSPARVGLLARSLALVGLVLGLVPLLSGCDYPWYQSVQRGYRGDGQVLIINPEQHQARFDELEIPPAAPPADAGGPRAKDVFKNVKVLGDLSADQLVRVMISMAAWVTDGEGCSFCHDMSDPSLDVKYTKVTARRMLQMVRYINSHWTKHVGTTGVTCFTCHRGRPVPVNLWFENPSSPTQAAGFTGWHGAQNAPMVSIGSTALPVDPFTLYLKGSDNVRVQATHALPVNGMGASIQQAQWTYSLMMVISKSLGVNCDYCHNTQSMGAWELSSPPRATAWYGIRMVRALNNNFEASVDPLLPAERHGPMGDGPKLYCATCHNGAFKPLYGISMLKDFPELQGDVAKEQDYLTWKQPGSGPFASFASFDAPALSQVK